MGQLRVTVLYVIPHTARPERDQALAFGIGAELQYVTGILRVPPQQEGTAAQVVQSYQAPGLNQMALAVRALDIAAVQEEFHLRPDARLLQ